MPKYLKISSAFRIGKSLKGSRAGIVVASAEAFFLVVGPSAIQMGLGGGLLGGALASALERWVGGKPKFKDDAGVLETDLADLPEAIADHPDWPVKQDEGPVLVIPREAVDASHYSFWKWGIFLQVGDVEFRIEPPFFGRKRKLDWLREAGWDV